MRSTNEENYVRLGVFDSFGNLLGFKSDTFWVLSDGTKCSVHLLEEVVSPQSPEMKSLIFFLNHPTWWKNNSRRISAGRFDDNGTLYVVAKDHETNQEMFRYTFSRNKTDTYSLASPKIKPSQSPASN